MASSIPIEGVKTILNVKIFIAPERVEEFYRHFRPAFEAVMAEPQCRYFVVSEDPQNPGTLSWTEGWTEDVQWLMQNQLTKPYYKPYLEATEPMFLKERE
ncbi:uncharacterized protein HMPREF1541_00801 [Cyphellophora europaea CBS 101466]|uniref:ABM domain-containing protein n=1 Tax=Cyphellophora europaea (strain CBS 101466) TaxID=1220924 RepID=W2SDB0_CYPE1|nr:uncharacterized protein HMPREF1541_00801 [Cyphellophora europaea CBS 101466]ETN46615.1 hypothetical protein HMPREF1541_00801 [Cyphellophora europaea CBS 101466]